MLAHTCDKWLPRHVLPPSFEHLSTFSPDTTSKLNVFRHDRHTFGMNSTQVGILEETDQVCLRGFLKGQHRGRLETQVVLEILCNLTDKTLERSLADQQLSRLLVFADFTKSNSTWTVTVRLLDTSGSRSGFTGCFGGELFTGRFASSGFTGGLLGTGHGLSVGQYEMKKSVNEEK